MLKMLYKLATIAALAQHVISRGHSIPVSTAGLELQRRGGDTVSVAVSSTPLSLPIPANSVGLSFEVSYVPAVFGDPALGQGVRKSFVNLMNVLRSASASSGPAIRITAADTSAYVPNATDPLPPGVIHRITDSDFAIHTRTVPLWSGSIEPGVIFRYPTDPSYAIAHVRALTAQVPRHLITAIEIGNECDLYHVNGVRPANYTRQQYASEWRTYLAAALEPFGMGAQGGTLCCNQTGFDLETPQLLPSTKVWSEHFYPLSVCPGKAPISTWDLLTDKASQAEAQQQAPLVALAVAQGIPFILGETNSVSCGGKKGVSDVFASTLWAVDQMFNAAAVNITGFRFHGGPPSDPYNPISYLNTSNIDDVPVVTPLFYGMWAFTVATAHNARVMAASVTSTEPYLKAWATHSEQTGITQVLFIHKNGNATAPAAATVVPASGAGNAGAQGMLTVLMPAQGGVYATEGLSFGGLSFDNSTVGLPVGTPVNTTVTAGANGAFTFSIAPASIAILSYKSQRT